VQDGRATARPDSVTAGDLDTGARIGRYVIIERVGTGAMGVVYGAYDPELDRKVALKLIKPGQGVKDTARARLLREAKAIARLQHPNVVAVHDVGVIDDQVFLAMEFVAGGTIKSWVAEKPRTWREILDVFIAAGRGLAAAHAAGLVHRDFKPDNVLLDKEHRPRVVDFGIARQAGAGDDLEGETGDVISQDGTATLRDSSGKHALATLTKTGTWVGTPAYMAPEQFLGERGDDKSDQFSFCVALYEALYGERPFAGDDMLSISVNVTTEQLRPLPKDRGVPTWLRRVILRGLRATPSERWDGMPALLRALETDPVVKLRRQLVSGGAVAVVAVTLLVAWQSAARRRADSDREIAGKLETARGSATVARTKLSEARALRQSALAAFDAMNSDDGETAWRRMRALLPAADAAYDQAERGYETALALDQTRSELRTELADVRFEHLLSAEDFRLDSRAQVLAERLASSDPDGRKRSLLSAPGTLALDASPGSAQIVLERYDRDPVTERREPRRVASLSRGRTTTALAPGSYRIVIDGVGLARVFFPFEIRRGETRDLRLTAPRASSIPAGYAYVPPGEFWFGDGDEQLRTQFLHAVPIHRHKTGAYLIALHETTYAEWIAFLNALPPRESARYAPNVSSATRGSLRLKDVEGVWQLTFQPTTQRYSAASGEPIVYVGRKTLARQDWLHFPVAGVSPEDAARYVAWLRATRRLPGARLCNELEWERAARGADDRLFPVGDAVVPDDANFDLTYGRVDSAYGPDVVGSHVASRSPFGVDDLMGNVFELVTSSVKKDEVVIRGGGYFFGSVNGRSTNREPVPATFRDVVVGIRICSSVVEGNDDGANE
jgi:formylglycine-generating enzyme required for sulfatase activity